MASDDRFSMILANVLFAGAPTLLIVGLALHRERAQGHPTRLLVASFLGGLVAVALAVPAGLLVSPLVRASGEPLRRVLEAFLIAAFLEEGAKYVVLTVLLRRSPLFRGLQDGIVYGVVASVGFAFLENAVYLGGPSHVMLLRAVTAVPLHAVAGGLVGAGVARSRLGLPGSALPWLAAAVGFHGLYDLLVFSGGPLIVICPILLASGVAATLVLYRAAGRRDRDAGRLPRRADGVPDRP